MPEKYLNKILTEAKSVVTVDKVKFTFIKQGTLLIHIERVYIREKNRSQGHLTKALKKVTEFADKNMIKLSACFCADKEEFYNPLRAGFAKNGFLPEGDYRNDVERYPHIRFQKI